MYAKLSQPLQRAMDLNSEKGSSSSHLCIIMRLEISQLNGLNMYNNYHDVVIEPPLQPLTGQNVIPATANRQHDARTDIHAYGFWGHWQSAFFDVRFFHSNACTKLPQLYSYTIYLCCI